MRRNNKLAGTYFCGNEASDYAKENGFLDYATLSKAFDAVLNNDIIKNTNSEIDNIVSNEVIDSNILENNGVTTNNNDDIVDNTIDLNRIIKQ